MQAWFKYKSWQALPFSFLLAAITLFTLLDWLGPLLMADMKPMPLLAMVRVLELTALLALILYFGQFQNIGLGLPGSDAWKVFVSVSLICMAGAGLIYLFLPDAFASVAPPSWVKGAEGIVLMAALAPVVEELFFRAVVYRMLRQSFGVIPAIALSAVCFSLMHGALALPQLAGGVIFAVAYEYSRNLWIPVLLHVGANTAVLLIASWLA